MIFRKSKNIKEILNKPYYHYVFYLLILLIPFTHKESFAIFDPDMIWAKYVLIIVAIAGILVFIKDIKSIFRDPLFLLLGFLLIIQYASLLISLDKINTLRYLLFQTAIFFSYPLIKKIVVDEKSDLSFIIGIYKIAVIFSLLFLFVQVYLQSNHGISIGGVWPVIDYPTRYGSIFWDVNHYAAYLGSAFFVFIGFLLSKWNKFSISRRIFEVILLFGILYAILMTGSRSAMIGIFVAVFILITLRIYKLTQKGKNKKSYLYTLLLGLSVVIIPLSIIYFFSEIIKQMFLYRSVSFFSHLFLLKAGISTGVNNFFTGVGTNAFHAHFRKSELSDAYYYIDQAAINLKLPLHNLWLEYFAESGVLSFIIFALIWLITIGFLVKIYIKDNDYISFGLLGGLLVYLVGGFMYSYKAEFFWIYVLIIFGFIYSYTIQKFKNSNKNILTNIKMTYLNSIKYILGKSVNFVNVTIISFSLLILIIPMFYVLMPLNIIEIKSFYYDDPSNYIYTLYGNIMKMLRYTFGNYIFTPRLFSSLVYIGVVILLFNLIKRYFNFLLSITITAIFISLLMINTAVLGDGFKLYLIYLSLIVANVILIILYSIKKYRYSITLPRKYKIPVLIILVMLIISSIYSQNNKYKESSYDSSLNFLSELAYNRSLFESKMIWVDEEIDPYLIYYYCDELVKDNDYKYNECAFINVRLMKIALDPRVKSLAITHDNNSHEVYAAISKVSEIMEYKEIDIGDYKLFYLEPIKKK